MNILVVHFEVAKNDRNTIREHLDSFKKYSDCNVVYLNAFLGTPKLVALFKFDLVIYHYTFLSQKWNGPDHFKSFLRRNRNLKEIDAYKIAMPQDEYVFSDLLCEFFKEYGVDSIYTCFYEKDFDKVYPLEKTGVTNIRTNLTGYMDEKSLEMISATHFKPHSERTIDVGYRARKLPFWLGRHGIIKWLITEKFLETIVHRNLIHDLSNDENKVFLGDNWYKFLSNTRVVLGCEGGASLLDTDGSVREKVNEFVEKNPAASFETVESNCFPGLDGNIELFAISPRHFEACMTRTCQVLIEGEYHGIFLPGVHFIELKKDFSNLEDVLDLIEDNDYCERIANQAYQDIILNCKYTYSKFVQTVIMQAQVDMDYKPKIQTSGVGKKSLEQLFLFTFFRMLHELLGLAHRLWYFSKKVFFPVIKTMGLAPTYRKFRSRLLRDSKI